MQKKNSWKVVSWKLYVKLLINYCPLYAEDIKVKANSDWFMFNVTDQKRADIYKRYTRSVKGYSCQQADKYFYIYRD